MRFIIFGHLPLLISYYFHIVKNNTAAIPNKP